MYSPVLNQPMLKFRLTLFLCLFGFLIQSCAFLTPAKNQKYTGYNQGREIWTQEQANQWYAKQGWLVGPNFIPSTAINQLEMWQAESFDTTTINRELGWAQDLGMNSARVYLHDLPYQQDSIGFFNRIDYFLKIAQRHQIRPILVLFDSCWDPFPKLGKQPDPKPHVHNSGWVQSPGRKALQDSTQYPRLERYVKGIIKKFGQDQRIAVWDLWNEPDNGTGVSYRQDGSPDQTDFVLPLLKKTFVWARAANPSQPLTSGVWAGDWSSPEKLNPIEKVQLTESDIITFHNYSNPQDFEKCIVWLQQYGRPILCTEYMARPNGSTFAGSLPIAKKYKVGMYNWGFVAGKTQTIYPWASMKKQYSGEPPVWFHDVLRTDGTPYKPEEVDLIRRLTAAGKPIK